MLTRPAKGEKLSISLTLLIVVPKIEGVARDEK